MFHRVMIIMTYCNNSFIYSHGLHYVVVFLWFLCKIIFSIDPTELPLDICGLTLTDWRNQYQIPLKKTFSYNSLYSVYNFITNYWSVEKLPKKTFVSPFAGKNLIACFPGYCRLCTWAFFIFPSNWPFPVTFNAVGWKDLLF